MKALNDWAINNLGAWIADCGALFLMIALVLAVVLIVALIAGAVRKAAHKKKEKKFDSELAAANSVAADADAVRAEAEQVRAEAEALKSENENLRAETESLKAELTKKQHAIDELTARMVSAAKAPKPAQDDDDEDEYYDDYGDETSDIKVTLKFDRLKNNWIIRRSDSDKTFRRVPTKQEAIVVAKDLAKRLNAQLVVHKKDGKFQRI